MSNSSSSSSSSAASVRALETLPDNAAQPEPVPYAAPLDSAGQQRFYRRKNTLKRQGEKMEADFETQNFFMVLRPVRADNKPSQEKGKKEDAEEDSEEEEGKGTEKRRPRSSVWVHCTPGSVGEAFWKDPRAVLLFEEHLAKAGYEDLVRKATQKKLQRMSQGPRASRAKGGEEKAGTSERAHEPVDALARRKRFAGAYSGGIDATREGLARDMRRTLKRRLDRAVGEQEEEGKRWAQLARQRKRIEKAHGKRKRFAGDPTLATFHDGDAENECFIAPFEKPQAGGKKKGRPAKKAKK